MNFEFGMDTFRTPRNPLKRCFLQKLEEKEKPDFVENQAFTFICLVAWRRDRLNLLYLVNPVVSTASADSKTSCHRICHRLWYPFLLYKELVCFITNIVYFIVNQYIFYFFFLIFLYRFFSIFCLFLPPFYLSYHILDSVSLSPYSCHYNLILPFILF